MKNIKYIIFVIFLLGGTALILLSNFFPNEYHLVSLLSLIMGIITISTALLDLHLDKRVKILTIIVGLLFAINPLIGLILKEETYSIETYCMVFAIIEICNGIMEMSEALLLLKEKNNMWVAFLIDAFIEIILGMLMIRERDETLRTHVILIGMDLYFEGFIKFINKILEERNEHAHD